MDELMIKIDGVKKQYKLGQIGGTTLRDELQRLHAKIHKKEDPTKKIGAKNYNQGEKFMALDGVSFEVKKGERVGIIGHNGAGKSTLLKLISRITAPTEGSISLNGRVASMLEVGTGFHGELTGRENIYMNGAILGMTKKEIDAKIESIIDFSECREFIDTPVKRYSSGMYVKLAFSVAAHLDSEIVIMDEVLAVGDVNFQQKCLNKMRDISLQEGRTILYVSHNMNTIRQLCDRVIVLNHGKLIFDGDVEEGIEIYSKKGGIVVKDEYDLSVIDREGECDGVLKMEKLSVDGYEFSDLFNFRLTISSQNNLNNCLIRFMVTKSDYVTIGTAYSDLFDLKEGENIIKFSLDLSEVCSGEYFASIALADYNGNIQTRHDILRKVVGFSVVKDDNVYGIKWNSYGWGSVKLNNIKVENENYS